MTTPAPRSRDLSVPTRASRARRLLAALAYVVVGLGVPLAAVGPALDASPTRLLDTFDGDAYYYFEIARNLAAGHGSTYERIGPTNGYHPLWQLLLPMVLGAPDGDTSEERLLDAVDALRRAKVLGGVAFAAQVALLWLLGATLRAEAELSPALVLLIFQRDLWLSGMETTVLLPLLTAVLVAALRSRLFRDADAPLLPVALLLPLVLLARLDAVFFVAVLPAVYLVAGPATLALVDRLRRAALLGLPSAVALGVYLSINLAVFGTATPVSGQAKQLGGPFLHAGPFVDYLTYRPVLAPLVERLPLAGWWLLVLGPSLLLLRAAGRRRHALAAIGRSPLDGLVPLVPLEPLLWALVGANLVQLSWYAVTSSWPLWRWYFYYPALLVPLALMILTRAALSWATGWAIERIPSSTGRPALSHRALSAPDADPRVARRWLAVALSLLVAGAAGVKLVRVHDFERRLDPPSTKNYKTRSIDVARALHDALPADAVVAMGDRAGSLGYLLDRPLLQLEGLVAPIGFLDVLERGEVEASLAAQGVDALVYSGGPGSGGDPRPLADRPGCAAVREPKWGRGPTFELVVCEADRIGTWPLASSAAMGGTVHAWRLALPRNEPARPR